jgi:hypothetical protein
MGKKLRLWNGRPYGVLPQSEWKHSHICVAAYSMADARRVCLEAGMSDPGATEVKEYWSECWGDDMNGIAPERGIWITKGGQAKKLPSNVEFSGDAPLYGAASAGTKGYASGDENE